jgi:hypothetical protein
MNFQPYPTRSGYIAIGIALICEIIAIILLNQLPQQESLPEMFTLFIAALIAVVGSVMILGWAILSFRLCYHINRNGVIIHWGFAQQSIPITDIQEILSGKNLLPPNKFRGLNIAGLRFGVGELIEHGATDFYTTTNLTDSLLIITPEQAYYVSPHDQAGFIEVWKSRQALGPTQQWEVASHRNWPFNIPILADRLSWGLIGVGLLICLALFGYLAFAFPELPRTIPLQFDAIGQISRTADKAVLFLFPIVGAILLGVNALLGGLAYQQERLAAYFAWGTAVLVQICLWIAVYSLVGHVAG